MWTYTTEKIHRSPSEILEWEIISIPEAWNMLCSKTLANIVWKKHEKNLENKIHSEKHNVIKILPPSDGDFTDRIVSASEAHGSLSRMVLSMEMKPYLRGFHELLKRWGVIEIIVSRTGVWSRH